MKIALIGATGYTGAPLTAEALRRGHQVTAIARDPGKLADAANLTKLALDLTDAQKLEAALKGHDVVISAFNPGAAHGEAGKAAIVAAAKAAGVRLIVVGGAGSLLDDQGTRIVDRPDFPAEWKGGALATAEFLDRLKATAGLDWTLVSPAKMLVPGERTGKYRTGLDHPVTLPDGNSTISVQDYAVALLDEAEKPAHRGQRFTVGY